DGDGVITGCDVPDVVASGDPGTVAYSGDTGAVLWSLPGVMVTYDGAIAGGDVNGDGRNEVVVVAGNVATCYDDRGALLWTSAATNTVSINAPQVWDVD